MKKKLAIVFSLITSTSFAQSYVGIEGGLGFADIGAKDTAQTLANLAGQTVGYKYDRATVAGRIYVGTAVAKDIRIEAGYFSTGNIDATYSTAGASAKEGYSVSGFEFSGIFKPETSPFLFKAGFHSSKVNGSGSISIGGTTYAASTESSGTGFLLGLGYEDKFGEDTYWQTGVTYYNKIGGSDQSTILVGIGLLKKF